MRFLGLLFLGGFIFLDLLPGQALALEVADGVISTAVVNRNPVDIIERYPAAAGKVSCFTHLTGAEGVSRIFHVWYRGQQEMGRIELPVRAADWKTWSTKDMFPDWTGAWRVEVIDQDGRLLKVIPFTLL